MNEYTEIGMSDLTGVERSQIEQIAAKNQAVRDALKRYDDTREAARSRLPQLLPSQDEPLLDLREAVRVSKRPGTKLICGHTDLVVPIRPGEEHHCPGVTLNCWCDPVEVTV